jgi:hypothetical protein
MINLQRYISNGQEQCIRNRQVCARPAVLDELLICSRKTGGIRDVAGLSQLINALSGQQDLTKAQR